MPQEKFNSRFPDGEGLGGKERRTKDSTGESNWVALGDTGCLGRGASDALGRREQLDVVSTVKAS